MGEYDTEEGIGLIAGPELRRMLRDSELAVANLKGLGAAVVDLLRTLDRIAEALEILRDRGMDVRPEEARLEAIQGILRRKTSVLLKELRVVGGLANARAEEDALPAERYWWWYLDAAQREGQRIRLRRVLRFVGIGVLVLVLAAFAYRQLVPYDPSLQAKFEHVGSAERHVEEGDTSAALAEYEAARALDPEDQEILIWLGVLYERQGRVAEAQALFGEAERLAEGRAEFLVMRAFCYMRLGDTGSALADGQDAVALDPDSAQAHLVLANSYEVEGDIRMALEELEIAAQLAYENGNDSLYVIAKTQQAMLMQRGFIGAPPPEATVEK